MQHMPLSLPKRLRPVSSIKLASAAISIVGCVHWRATSSSTHSPRISGLSLQAGKAKVRQLLGCVHALERQKSARLSEPPILAFNNQVGPWIISAKILPHIAIFNTPTLSFHHGASWCIENSNPGRQMKQPKIRRGSALWHQLLILQEILVIVALQCRLRKMIVIL
jgi:hypothetical protein